MKLELTLLRTRVARRMLILFLACAIGPVVTLGGAAYLFVAHSLRVSRADQLHQDGNIAGQLILGHLQDLAAELKNSQLPGNAAGRTFATGNDAPAHGASFVGIAIERDDGTITRVGGRIDRIPTLTAERVGQLVAGRATLVVTAKDSVPGVYMAVPALGGGRNGYPRTWGYLTLGRLLDGVDGIREGTQLCVLDRELPITCTGNDPAIAGAQRATVKPQRARAPAADPDGVITRNVFLKYEFGVPAWTIRLTQSGGGALDALPIFRRLFILGIVFAIVLVFTLSHSQIRQRMTPLADLEAGTRRLRGGDFTTRVEVESGDEFQSLATSFNRMAADLQRQFATLSALRDVDSAALQHRTSEAIAAAALQGAPQLFGAQAVALATAGADETNTWRVQVLSAGESGGRSTDVQPSASEVAELASIPDYLPITERQLWPSYCRVLRNYGCGQFVVFPVHGQGRPIGALIVGFASDAGAREEMFPTGRQLADQLALGLSNVSLLDELDAMSVGALTALARTVDAASHWTGGHSERVTTHAVEIGRRLGLDVASLAKLRQGGLLHDIGKIGVPATILDKPGPLTDEELAVMQSHPRIGAEIVQSVRAFGDLVPLVLHHHELLDGTGYPAQLRGNEIPELVRILTVADVFDALVSNRPYRAGLSIEVALAVLTEGSGTKFEACAVDTLRAMVAGGWAPSRIAVNATDAKLPELDRRMLIGIGHAEQAA